MAGNHSLEDIERGLREMAHCRGNRELACQRLKERGRSIPVGTLNRWAYVEHRARYAEIRSEVEGQVHETIADEYETLALRAIEVQNDLLGDLSKKRDELSPKELATALNATATAGGIATDKSSVLRGRATVIVENRNPYELLSRWMPAIQQYVDGSAEEIPTADGGMTVIAEGVAGTATGADPKR